MKKRTFCKKTNFKPSFNLMEKCVVTKHDEGEIGIWDCFDGSIESANCLLLSFKGRLIFIRGHEILFDVKQKRAFKMVEEIEDHAFRASLKRIVGIRALLSKHSSQLIEECMSFEDLFGKIVLKLSLWSFSRGDLWFNLAQLVPLKGYESELRHAENILSEEKWQTCEGFPIDEFYDGLDITPHSKERGKFPSFDSGDKAGFVVPSICMHLIGTVEENVQGMIDDVDTEFAHDFRVATRISRSILKQMKKTISEDLLEQGQKFLSGLGKLTNPLRDYDVYLLDETRYCSMIPESHRPYLEPFFKYIARKRKTAWKEVAAYMQSSQFEEDKAAWHHGLEAAQDELAGLSAAKPIGTLASERIIKRFNSVLKEGNLIHDDTPDFALHDLRINCKKLRYLLDVFGALYDPSIKVMMKKMKRLQSLLGDFNDLSVQQEYFKTYSEGLSPNMKDRDLVLMALGMLLAKFHQLKMQLREHFHQEFEAFCSAEAILMNALKGSQ